MVNIELCVGLMILSFVAGIVATLLAINSLDKRFLNGGKK